MRLSYFTAILALCSLSANAQTGADYMKAMKVAGNDIMFDVNAEGKEYKVNWGMDAAWDWDYNVYRGIAHVGVGNFATGRVSFQPVDLVIDNGDGTYRKNDIAIDPQTYWESVSRNAPSMFIYDNSYVKCREITFGYTFPEKMLGKFVKALNVSFVARNPFIIWKNIPNIDPDSG